MLIIPIEVAANRRQSYLSKQAAMRYGTDLIVSGRSANGLKEWAARIRKAEEKFKGSGEFYRQTHGELIRAFVDRFPIPGDDPLMVAATSFSTFEVFAVALHWVDSILEGTKWQRDWRGRLHSSFTDSIGVAPIATELAVLGQMWSKGWDVQLNDISKIDAPGSTSKSGRRYDFLSKRDGYEFEVECKTISVEKGWPISQRSLAEFSRVCSKTPVIRRLGLSDYLVVVRVNVTEDALGKTKCSKDLIGDIVDSICSTDQSFPRSNSWCDTSIDYFKLSSTDLKDPADVGHAKYRLALDKVGAGDCFYLAVWTYSGSCILFVFRSDRDRREEYVLDEIQDALLNQLSGTRPGIVAIRFVGMTRQDVKNGDRLGTWRMNFAQICNRLVSKYQDLPQFHSLAIVSPYEDEFDRMTSNLWIPQKSGVQTISVFPNPHHPVAHMDPFGVPRE